MSIRCNDNLEELKKIPTNSIDLVYIDPPFNTGKHQGDYDDRFESMNDYLNFIKTRLIEIHRILKDSGTIYFHADRHASHHLRMLMDDVFGPRNFGNEIIWHYGGPSPAKQNFPGKHDTIFRYMKGSTFTFHPQYEKYKKNHNFHFDDDGSSWIDQNIGNISKKKFNELKREGRVYKTKTGNYRRKQYLDRKKGKVVDDVWSIPIINSQARERLDYATQKPEKLLERIILTSSNEGDIILDAFAGSGTTCAVANKLGRHSICIDQNPKACKIMEERLS